MLDSKILAFIGEQRAGKGTAAGIYKQLSESRSKGLSISRHTFSDIVREILKERNIEFGRVAARELVMSMINEGGGNALSNLMEKRLKDDPSELIILDGIRLWSDYTMLSRFHSHNLVYVTASAEIRYQRAMRDSEKSDEANISFDEFMRRECHRLERDIPAIGINKANYYVLNNGNLNELKERMEELYDEIKF